MMRRLALLAGALAFTFTSFVCPPVTAGESTMPPQFADQIDPQMATKYVYTEDGPYTKQVGIPTYEWTPAGSEAGAMVLGVHGLTLHGRRYRVLARSLAVHGMDFVSMDMRGFGRCLFDDKKQFSTPDNDRTKIDNEKSYQDIVNLAKAMKAAHPDRPLIALGESLGCTFVVRLAGEHPELVSGLILSAPAVKLNHDMYLGKGQVAQGLKSVVTHDHEMDLTSFFAELCSQRADVQKEMSDDPLILKKITLRRLIAVDFFVDKTVDWGKLTAATLPVLILQGGHDGCVAPKHVTDLMAAMPSDDVCLSWRGKFGHLQLETIYMRAQVIDALANWIRDHRKENKERLASLEKDIAALGGKIAY